MQLLLLWFATCFVVVSSFTFFTPRRLTALQVSSKTPLNGSISFSTKLSVSFVPSQFDPPASTSSDGVVDEDSLQQQLRNQREGTEVRVSSLNSSLNLPLFRGICESQALVLAVTALVYYAALGFAWQQQLHGVLPLSELPHDPLSHLLLIIASSITTFLLLFMNEWIAQSTYRPASQIHFATTHLVYTLFGRRRRQPQPQDSVTLFLSSGVLALITAVCQEITFRGFVLDFFLKVSPDSLVTAVVGQALLYAGVMPVSSTSIDQEEDHSGSLSAAAACTVVFGGAWKFIQGLLLGMVAAVGSESFYGSGGGLSFCILAQWLVNWHIWIMTWFQVNNQMDWVERQDLPQAQSSATSPNQSPHLLSSSLSPELYQSLFRFYCAFDSSHRRDLSLEDVQRAVSYAFWHVKTAPTHQQVEELVLSQKNITTDKSKNDHGDSIRLNFDEFLAILFALRIQSLGPEP